MKERGITFKDVIDAYQSEKVDGLVERAPLADAVLGMVVKHHPPPHEAVKYRIPQIWKGDLDSDIGKALLACSDDGPTIMMSRKHGARQGGRPRRHRPPVLGGPSRTGRRSTSSTPSARGGSSRSTFSWETRGSRSASWGPETSPHCWD